MKNPPKSGNSVRSGNAPSPYTKYEKSPYRYSWQKATSAKGRDKR